MRERDETIVNVKKTTTNKSTKLRNEQKNK